MAQSSGGGSNMCYSVYWAHLPDHKDIKTEGYVGYFSHFSRPGKQKYCQNYRSQSWKRYPFADALRIHRTRTSTGGGKTKLIWNIIQPNLSLEEALIVQKLLRPSPKIGWNLQEGGVINYGTDHYEVFRRDIKKNDLSISLGIKLDILYNFHDILYKRNIIKSVLYKDLSNYLKGF